MSTDSDYLHSGGISTDFATPARRGPMKVQPKKEDLYLKGYGRQFGEEMTYSLGLSYGLGTSSSIPDCYIFLRNTCWRYIRDFPRTLEGRCD